MCPDVSKKHHVFFTMLFLTTRGNKNMGPAGESGAQTHSVASFSWWLFFGHGKGVGPASWRVRDGLPELIVMNWGYNRYNPYKWPKQKWLNWGIFHPTYKSYFTYPIYNDRLGARACRRVVVLSSFFCEIPWTQKTDEEMSKNEPVVFLRRLGFATVWYVWCLEKVNTYSAKWCFNGDLPWYKVERGMIKLSQPSFLSELIGSELNKCPVLTRSISHLWVFLVGHDSIYQLDPLRSGKLP